MAHDLAKNAKGEYAFISLLETPWHKNGIVALEEMEGLPFIQMVGLDYEVSLCPLEAQTLRGAKRGPTGWDAKTDSPTMGLTGGEELRLPHPKFGVYRADTGQLLPETVGPGFELYQNREIISFFDGLVKDRRIVYECAGALGAGEEVWVLAHIPDLNMAIRGDENRTYMLIRNGHCGNATLQCFPTTIRVVCRNTMAMAKFNRASAGEPWQTNKGGYFIRHTRNMRTAVEQVQSAYDQVLRDFDNQRQLYEFLAETPVTDQTRRQFLTWFALQGRDEKKLMRLYTEKEAGQELGRGDKTSLSRFEGLLDTLETLYESPNNQQPGTRNTVYSALQTVIEYVDHHRATRCAEGEDCDLKRFQSAVFGSGEALKIQATAKAVELALSA